MMYLFILTIGLLATIDAATVHAGNNEEMLETLFERIKKLEVNDVADKREIAALKSEMNDMKMTFTAKEERLLAEIDSLKTELRKNAVAEDENETKTASSTKIDKSGHKDVGNTMKKELRTDGQDSVRTVKRSIKVRESVETEVAFYATHSQHDVQHLGQNQIIVFDQAITNVGNAYNPITGGFVAPADGTYIFHVTMMGKDVHTSTSNHFSAHIDVDGTVYSQLWVEPYQQSSQMFVSELKAGQTVSVKNHVLDDGYIGQHMSSFSGFLLYEHPGSVIVGK